MRTPTINFRGPAVFSRLVRAVTSPDNIRRGMNLWSPFRGAGIRVESISKDFNKIRVVMDLRWFNVNYVGTHFGGSLYAMTDPFYMLMVMQNLGRDYLVWDKAAVIDFIRPGKGRVAAEFEIGPALVEEIREKTAGGQPHVFSLPVEVVDSEGQVVARVLKTLYVRKKTPR